MRLLATLLLAFTFSVALLRVKAETTEETAPQPSVELSGLADETLKKLSEKAESHTFEAEVDKMMKLIINSLYKNKEIFLRELISNASDAMDKIRILSLSDPKALEAYPDLHIYIKADPEKRQLIIRDSGIGMTKKDLSTNLGTIAKSGTSDFLKKFSEAKTTEETTDLIGQFGVGFYSAFLVADKITVISKHNDDDQYVWESDSVSYTLNKDPRGNTLKRGTEIVLHLKEEAQDYLKLNTLDVIAKKYSQFINFPIYMWTSETRMVEPDEADTADDDKNKPDEAEDKKKKEDEEGEDTVEEEKDDSKKKEKVQKEFWLWTQLNKQRPIWKRAASDVSAEEYKSFFKAITPKAYEEELAHVHFKAEGDINFNSILYIPDSVHGDFFAAEDSRVKPHVKIYVRRVFITDEIKDLIPRYLAFIRGVIDSEDLPLNVSRETLQQNKLMKLIKRKVVRKILDMIAKLDKETFDKFWDKYAVNLKVGVWEDRSNSARIAKMLRFKTTKTEGAKDFVTLNQYVERMKKGQKKIFYVTAASPEEAKRTPFVERAIKLGYEVLLLTDSVDEYMMMSLTEFDEYGFQDLGKEGVEFHETDESKANLEELRTEFKPLTDWLAKTALSDKISKADVSNLLTDSPCALVASGSGWTGSMERMMLSNSFKSNDDPNIKHQMGQKRQLQLNPRHPLVKELKALHAHDSADEKMLEMAQMLYDTAMLRSGFMVHDTADFAKRIERVMRKNLNIDEHATADEDPYLQEVPDSKKDEDKTEATEQQQEEKEKKEEQKEEKEKDAVPPKKEEASAAEAAKDEL